MRKRMQQKGMQFSLCLCVVTWNNNVVADHNNWNWMMAADVDVHVAAARPMTNNNNTAPGCSYHEWN
jgi:hypothetical protein